MAESDIDTHARWEMMPANAMSASLPIISVIVVCRNPGPRLREALGSVWSQTEPAELVVVDGASTDGTADWLRAQAARITTLVSEPDEGVYHAMNKGAAKSKADWILFLGSDDRLASPTVLAEAARHLMRIDANVAVGSARYDDGRLYAFAGENAAIRRNFVHHQAAFYQRSLLKESPFDTSLRLQADYDSNLRLLHARARFNHLPVHVSECASGGMSDAGRWANYREEILVRHRHFPAWRCWLWDGLAITRYLRKKTIRLIRSHASNTRATPPAHRQ